MFTFLQDTEIGKAVNGLRRHSSDKISKLAKTLFAYEFYHSHCVLSFICLHTLASVMCIKL